MITFLDGPAKEKTLTLKRAPHFLRVCDDGGEFDALDQLIDQPRAREKLYAYVLANEPIHGFIDGSKYRGPFVAAMYRLVGIQPTDAEMRTTAAWRAWCEKNRPTTPPTS